MLTFFVLSEILFSSFIVWKHSIMLFLGHKSFRWGCDYWEDHSYFSGGCSGTVCTIYKARSQHKLAPQWNRDSGSSKFVLGWDFHVKIGQLVYFSKGLSIIISHFIKFQLWERRLYQMKCEHVLQKLSIYIYTSIHIWNLLFYCNVLVWSHVTL